VLHCLVLCLQRLRTGKDKALALFDAQCLQILDENPKFSPFYIIISQEAGDQHQWHGKH